MKWINYFLENKIDWFSNRVEEHTEFKDIYIGHKIEFYRNIAKHTYPHFADESSKSILKERIIELVGSLHFLGNYFTIDIKNNSDLLFLHEAGIFSIFNLSFPTTILLDFNMDRWIIVNQIDNIIFGIKSGNLEINKSWAQLDHVEKSIGSYFKYDYSNEWGYLTSNLQNTGLGAKIFLIFHIPGILLTKQYFELAKLANKYGFGLTGFFITKNVLSSNIAVLYNKFGLGISDKELKRNSYKIIEEIVTFENEQREDLFAWARNEISDKIWRSYGILKTARILSLPEFNGAISGLRLGLGEGYLSRLKILDMRKIDDILVSGQNKHIEFLAKYKENLQNPDIDFIRGHVIRKLLSISGSSKQN